MNFLNKIVLTTVLKSTALLAVSPDYVENWNEKNSEKLLICQWICQKDLIDAGCKSDYLNPEFAKVMQKDKVSVIFEVGSRDAIDALCLSEHFKAKVYAFECNPEGIKICKHNIGNNPNIIFVPLAVWNETKTLNFHPVTTEQQEANTGLSSMFKIAPDGGDPEIQKQREIGVQATRLDEWMDKEKINYADLICIDVQGGTLQVLQGLGKKLANTKYIIAEVENRPYYIGQSLFPEVKAYLASQGFTPQVQLYLHDGLYKDVFDVLFVRNDLQPGQR